MAIMTRDQIRNSMNEELTGMSKTDMHKHRLLQKRCMNGRARPILFLDAILYDVQALERRRLYLSEQDLRCLMGCE